VASMMGTKKNCTGMDAKLPESKLIDLLLDPGSTPAKVQTHVAECGECRGELDELKATMDLLDAWQAPEPSPYFMTRFEARLREEREAAPAGWFARRFARLHDRMTYGSGLHARPLAAMALTVMLLIGGGAYLDLTMSNTPTQSNGQNAAVVHDLQTLDSNAQVLDQMEALSTSSNGD
jgi:hypothetical protein